MSYTIAVAGKGGVGKTSLATISIKFLKAKYSQPILAVDADPNSNLNELLGIPVSVTIADVLEESQNEMKKLPLGMSKERYMESRINDVLVESDGIDLFVMGRTGGPGCYCYPNALLRKYLDTISSNYNFIVIDNEAGLEHLSRRTTRNADILFIVSDSSIVGIRAAARIKDISQQLKLNIKKTFLVVNKVSNNLPKSISDEIKRQELELIGAISYDEEIYNFAIEGRSLLELSESNKTFILIREIWSNILSS